MVLTDFECGLRKRSKRKPYGAKAGAVLGIAACLGVTALLAHEFSRYTGVFAATPAPADTPIARAEDTTSFKALRVHHSVPVAEIALNEPPKVADAVHINRPAQGAQIGDHRDATGPRAAAHPSDTDPLRFPAPQASTRPASPGTRDRWISASPFEVAELNSAAAAASVSAFERRMGAASLAVSAEEFAAPVMIALALAETEAEAETVVALKEEAEDAAVVVAAEVAAGAVAAPAPVELAMVMPVPVPRPQPAPKAVAVSAPVAPAGMQAALTEAATAAPEVVPARRPARSAGKPAKPESVLAYASPDVAAEEEKTGGIFGRLLGGGASKRLPGPGSKVAVYDISTATVHMPNGRKLEAHSGLAHMQDDPGYIKEKNKGPTPPNLYNLQMRESRFHGVEAIRLLPADGRKKFNRDGLLAHTYMYVGGGSRSQSNGCVVFAKYQEFLTAFKKGEIKRLIVVQSMDKLPTYLAAL